MQDILSELYDDDTRVLVEKRKADERLTADLSLMHTRRERQVQTIFRDHKLRQAEIYGEEGNGMLAENNGTVKDALRETWKMRVDAAPHFTNEHLDHHRHVAFKKSVAQRRFSQNGECSPLEKRRPKEIQYGW